MSLVVPKHSWVSLCEPCDNRLFKKICKMSTFKWIPLAGIFDLPLISILMLGFVFMAPSEILFHKMVCVFFALLLAHFSLSAMTKLGYFHFLSSPSPMCPSLVDFAVFLSSSGFYFYALRCSCSYLLTLCFSTCENGNFICSVTFHLSSFSISVSILFS